MVAVVVAYNRANLLTDALSALAAQTRPLDAVVVVDNASPDDSGDRARRAGADVVTLPTNTGGAGGFTAGLARALDHHRADLVWLMDDDTVPSPDALEQLLQCRDAYPGAVRALASRVVWTDGRDHPMNTPRRRPRVPAAHLRAATAVGAVPVRSMSFVSMLVDGATTRRLGLPVADYFLWNDDFEFSSRLLRDGVGLYVPASVVEHRTKVFGSTDADPGERFFNEVRNKVWMWRHSSALGPADQLLYGASAARRWARTIARSQRKRLLLTVGARGLRAGLSSRPRPNAVVLSGMGDTTEEVARVETEAVRVDIGSDLSGLPQAAPEPFSVLLPVYRGDRSEHVRRAVESVTTDQTLRPAELVIVRDGPVSAQIEDLLCEYEAHGVVPTRVVRLDTNVGLATALERGLAECRYEIVARADADDVSLPQRFAEQLPLVSGGLDLLGTAIAEFEADETRPGHVRYSPATTEEIATYARFHDPFNHPSVVYRRSAVQAAGGYRHLDLLEDYWLFTRMIAAGARTANLREPLVLYRVGAGAYRRRGGRRLLFAELELQRRLYAEGFTTTAQMVRNVALRGGYRLIPEGTRRAAYRALVLAPKQRRAQRAAEGVGDG